MTRVYKSRTWNFNSHAHVERDGYHWITKDKNGISTHTLTWSVTDNKNKILYIYGISTHTLTWSVTSNQLRHITNSAFQLTRSRGA